MSKVIKVQIFGVNAELKGISLNTEYIKRVIPNTNNNLCVIETKDCSINTASTFAEVQAQLEDFNIK